MRGATRQKDEWHVNEYNIVVGEAQLSELTQRCPSVKLTIRFTANDINVEVHASEEEDFTDWCEAHGVRSVLQ